MPTGLEAAAGIDGHRATRPGLVGTDEIDRLARRRQTEVLHSDYLGDREAVVHLGEVDVGRRDVRLSVRLPGGEARGRKRGVLVTLSQ